MLGHGLRCAIISYETNLSFMEDITRLNVIQKSGWEVNRIVFRDNGKYVFHGSLKDHF